MKRLLKILKYFFITLMILVLLIGGAGFVIVYFYEDEVKNYVISELNKGLATEISIKDVKFSVFSKFPDASLEFTDVMAKSAKGFNKKEFAPVSTDTLFAARSIFLQFNILDIFRKNYRIKKIHAYNGKLNLFIDSKGGVNFNIWKARKDSVQAKVQLALEDLRFNKIRVTYIDINTGVKLRSNVIYMDLSGNLGTAKHTIRAESSMIMDHFYVDKINYADSRNISVDLDLAVDKGLYTIRAGQLSIPGMEFDLKGLFDTKETTRIDLAINAKNLNIKNFIAVLPVEYRKYFQAYNSNGDFYFNAAIKGQSGNGKNPHFEVAFGIRNAEIINQKSDLRLKGVQLKGFFSNGKNNSLATSFLKLDDFSARFGNGKLTGKYLVENFSSPMVEFTANADIDLKELQDFIRIDTIESINGSLVTGFRFSGKMKSLDKFTGADFRNSKSEGKLKFANVDLKLRNSSLKYTGASGSLTFNNNDIKIDTLKFNIGKNDFDLTGYLKNILSYVMVENQPLYINASVKSESFDLDDFFAESAGKESPGEQKKMGIPDNVAFSLDLRMGKFAYAGFTATNARTLLSYSNNRLLAQDVSFNSLDGAVNGQGMLTYTADKKYIIQCAADLDDINICKLFTTFRNFGQEFIKDKHLNGILNASVDFSSEWTEKFEVIPEKIYAQSTVDITNGELIDFEPLQKLSKFIEVSELKQVKFSKLKNDILIKDKKVFIPKMNINSSAFNLEISGEHGFNKEFIYHIKILMSELLAKKARKAKKENEEFGVIEDDGLGKTALFLSIKGNGDDFKISYDAKMAKQEIKEDFKKEKETLKTILNEEFGWFKKDSAVIKAKTPESDKANDSKIRIKWDENDPQQEDEDLDDGASQHKKKQRKKLFQ